MPPLCRGLGSMLVAFAMLRPVLEHREMLGWHMWTVRRTLLPNELTVQLKKMLSNRARLGWFWHLCRRILSRRWNLLHWERVLLLKQLQGRDIEPFWGLSPSRPVSAASNFRTSHARGA